jgi:hypothetical protein
VPGSATIGSNLVDSLLSTVDDLRGSLNTDMGTRQWRVYVQRRTYASGVVGSGAWTATEIELTPAPLVAPDDRTFNDSPGGRDEGGFVTLSEVSLTYTEDELNPPYILGSEIFYRLAEAHGQSQADRLFQLADPPKADRVETIGWIIRLREVNVDGCQ